VLPESLPKERRTNGFDWSHANPFGALKLLKRYPQVRGLICVIALIQFAHMVYPTTFVLYADYRFGWGTRMVGITLALVGVLTAIVQGGLIRRIVAAFGERRALMFGLGMGTLGFLLYGLAPNGYIFWLMMPVTAFWGVAQPAAQALMTHLVDQREQGRLQGATSSISSLSGIAGAIGFPTAFSFVAGAKIQGLWAGTTFFMASAILLVDLLLAWYISTHLPISTDGNFGTRSDSGAIGSASDVHAEATEVTEPPHA